MQCAQCLSDKKSDEMVSLSDAMICPTCCLTEVLVMLRRMRRTIDDESFLDLELTIALAEETLHRQSARSQMLGAHALASLVQHEDVRVKLRECASIAVVLFGSGVLDHLLSGLSG